MSDSASDQDLHCFLLNRNLFLNCNRNERENPDIPTISKWIRNFNVRFTESLLSPYAIISATFATIYVMRIMQLLKFKQLIHVTCVCEF